MTEAPARQVHPGSTGDPFVRSDAVPATRQAASPAQLIPNGAGPQGGPVPAGAISVVTASGAPAASRPLTASAPSRTAAGAGWAGSPIHPRLDLGNGPLSDSRGRYTVELARDAADLRAAQRLRHEVFAGEMGARLDSPVSGLDVDRLDAYCDHLLVRSGDEVVGTYRMLAPGRSDRLYSEGEFDLSALRGIRGGLVEVGRTCVHPDHRGGAVIGLMWAGIARYMVAGGFTWLGGCCSVPLADGGTTAAGVLDQVGLGPERYRVTPRNPWTGEGVARPDRLVVPSLLRGYLRLGAWVCGAPAHDPEFGTADFFVLLSLANVDTRYLRHFLGVAE
ncbi:hypothetical protein Sme01_60040 [Sphaerisporangium melleum]|uniref:Hemolysin n=1 Tax=Sphaerisporangium melleum TaxID=321316 RepID=A0A917VNJ9_9ACTN|nr:GNAT family N-acyltransferase [Sphaerisporangium melleum]GGK98883.1 hypothetical protein GCM10007964_46230 [Sphaerisporangium melleum]GII73528.1 hypothetical protein Sme01_60040 [Sphaerisporangium melleum]